MGTRYLAPPNTKHKPTIKKIQYLFHSLTKLNNFYVIGNINGWLQIFFESQKQRSKRVKEKTQEEEKKKTIDILFQKFWRKTFMVNGIKKDFSTKPGKFCCEKNKICDSMIPNTKKKLKSCMMLWPNWTKATTSRYYDNSNFKLTHICFIAFN